MWILVVFFFVFRKVNFEGCGLCWVVVLMIFFVLSIFFIICWWIEVLWFKNKIEWFFFFSIFSYLVSIIFWLGFICFKSLFLYLYRFVYICFCFVLKIGLIRLLKCWLFVVSVLRFDIGEIGMCKDQVSVLVSVIFIFIFVYESGFFVIIILERFCGVILYLFSNEWIVGIVFIEWFFFKYVMYFVMMVFFWSSVMFNV